MEELYRVSYLLIFGFAIVSFILLFFVSAPYGKFTRKGWGKSIKTKWAWLIMEFPSPALMMIFFITSPQKDLPQIIFISFWLAHYLHRTFIYPFSQSGHEKPYPVLLVSMAFFFNCLNGFVNGWGLFHYITYSFSWIMTWHFMTGFMLFIAGFIINKTADEKLRRMRKDNPGAYVMPRGWLFNYISSPHYFGEIVEWSGWALMTFSVPGLAFAAFTFANLFPRAWASHQYYRKNFPEYPKNRKAVIPFII
jgi:protein-S-isoprenylcysteine O-methyltransferase Ste14